MLYCLLGRYILLKRKHLVYRNLHYDFFFKLKKTLAPTLAQTGYWYLYAGRVILGFCHGVTFPVMHGLTGHWAPELGQYITVLKSAQN